VFNPEDLSLVRKSWFRLANIPAKSQGWRLEDCVDSDPTDIDAIKDWLIKVQNGRVIRSYGGALCGRGLLFVGPSGRGKSTLASVILQEAITRFSLEAFKSPTPILARPCYFTSYVALISLKGLTMTDDATEKDYKIWQGILGMSEDDAFNIRMLVIDDVAKEHASKSRWEVSLLHEVLRSRFEKGLPTVITTNLTAEDWEGKYGSATRSFIQEAFYHLEVETVRGDLRLGDDES